MILLISYYMEPNIMANEEIKSEVFVARTTPPSLAIVVQLSLTFKSQ